MLIEDPTPLKDLIIRLRKLKTANIETLSNDINRSDLEIWNVIINTKQTLKLFKVLDFNRCPKTTRIKLTKAGKLEALHYEGIECGVFRS